jgi:hypothetical protein
MKNTKSNLNKLTATIIILLIAGFIAPLSTTMASNGNGLSPEEQIGTANNNNNNSETPSTNSDNQTTNEDTINSNMSENTRQYNRTDVTPKNQTEQVRAQEQTMFQYRNMTMLMNCTRNCTVTFTADEEVTPKVLGLSVDPNQTMTLAMNLTKSPLNGAMVNERCLNFYLGIEPNATLQLQAQIRLHINQTELSNELNREVNASRLTWMFWNQARAQWQAVESYMDQNGYLVCNTNHFSTWTVCETENNAGTITEQTDANTLPSILVVAGPIAAIVLVITVALIYKKRK